MLPWREEVKNVTAWPARFKKNAGDWSSVPGAKRRADREDDGPVPIIHSASASEAKNRREK